MLCVGDNMKRAILKYLDMRDTVSLTINIHRLSNLFIRVRLKRKLPLIMLKTGVIMGELSIPNILFGDSLQRIILKYLDIHQHYLCVFPFFFFFLFLFNSSSSFSFPDIYNARKVDEDMLIKRFLSLRLDPVNAVLRFKICIRILLVSKSIR